MSISSLNEPVFLAGTICLKTSILNNCLNFNFSHYQPTKWAQNTGSYRWSYRQAKHQKLDFVPVKLNLRRHRDNFKSFEVQTLEKHKICHWLNRVHKISNLKIYLAAINLKLMFRPWPVHKTNYIQRRIVVNHM